ncbi:EthD family reductase [Halomarina ordinaria]|uniref:EthD family reductase n=1 Tax=Halomarina ordinaria TaxID=3033939 RepID=A0ABD5U934_9EURY|nr:EthD family reductase [Halomarina sp. PSRA2]
MTTKIVFGLNRTEGMDREEFERYYLEEHAPMAEEMPNVERYTVAFADEGAPYDALAEVFFADREALDAALDSEAGRAAGADIANFADTDDVLQLVAEETVVVD